MSEVPSRWLLAGEITEPAQNLKPEQQKGRQTFMLVTRGSCAAA